MLPNNGRVVIVDDKSAEAAPLMAILSKNRIPFNYYSGEVLTEFPDDASRNRFRVLFLDLNIVETNKKIEDVISVLNGILTRLVPNNPNPYLLVIWSKKTEYREALIEHFENVLPEKQPAEIVLLDKGNYFDLDVASGSYLPQHDAYERLKRDLEQELNKLSVLGSLFVWENLVHDNALNTVNEFASFFPVNANWDANHKGLIRRLATATVGPDGIAALSDAEQVAVAFGSLNSFLSDRLEEGIVSSGLGNVTNVAGGQSNIPAEVVARINGKLHLSSVSPSADNVEQGNVYLISRNKPIFDLILSAGTINSPQNNLQPIRALRPKQVVLDLTPVCDYAQNKGYTRLLNGVLLPAAVKNNVKSTAYLYKTPVFEWKTEQSFILFDFRFVETVTRKVVKNMKPAVRFRKEICTDIQSQLSNQVNRPGIMNL